MGGKFYSVEVLKNVDRTLLEVQQRILEPGVPPYILLGLMENLRAAVGDLYEPGRGRTRVLNLPNTKDGLHELIEFIVSRLKLRKDKLLQPGASLRGTITVISSRIKNYILMKQVRNSLPNATEFAAHQEKDAIIDVRDISGPEENILEEKKRREDREESDSGFGNTAENENPDGIEIISKVADDSNFYYPTQEISTFIRDVPRDSEDELAGVRDRLQDHRSFKLLKLDKPEEMEMSKACNAESQPESMPTMQESLNGLSLEDFPSSQGSTLQLQAEREKTTESFRDTITKVFFNRDGGNWMEWFQVLKSAALYHFQPKTSDSPGPMKTRFQDMSGAQSLEPLVGAVLGLLGIPRKVKKPHGQKIIEIEPPPIIQLYRVWEYFVGQTPNDFNLNQQNFDDYEGDSENEHGFVSEDEQSQILIDAYSTKSKNFIGSLLVHLEKDETFKTATQWLSNQIVDRDVKHELQLDPDSEFASMFWNLSSYATDNVRNSYAKEIEALHHPPVFVVGYRGVNFMYDRWTRNGKEKYLQTDPSIALYSEAALHHDQQGQGCMYQTDVDYDEKKLKEKASQIRVTLEDQKKSGFVVAGNSRNLYNHRLDYLQSKYSNNIDSFFKAFRRLLPIDQLPLFDTNHGCKSESMVRNEQTSVLLNPFVSLSNQPKHAVKYAAGSKSEWQTSLQPIWLPDGRIINPCVGVVFVVLTPATEYLLHNPDDVCSIANLGRISLKYLIAPEKEVSYLGHAPLKSKVQRLIVEYPSFHKKWTPKFGKMLVEKFGMGKQIYEMIQRKILSGGKVVGLTGTSSTEAKKVDDPVADFIETYMMAFWTAKARKMAEETIESLGAKQVFIAETLVQDMGGHTGTMTRNQSQSLGDDSERSNIQYHPHYQLKSKAPYFLRSGATGPREVDKMAMEAQLKLRTAIGKESGLRSECPNSNESGMDLDGATVTSFSPQQIKDVLCRLIDDAKNQANIFRDPTTIDDEKARFLATTGLQHAEFDLA